MSKHEILVECPRQRAEGVGGTARRVWGLGAESGLWRVVRGGTSPQRGQHVGFPVLRSLPSEPSEWCGLAGA